MISVGHKLTDHETLRAIIRYAVEEVAQMGYLAPGMRYHAESLDAITDVIHPILMEHLQKEEKSAD